LSNTNKNVTTHILQKNLQVNKALPLPEIKTLPSVFILGKEPFALTKVRSAKCFPAKGLCRVLFIRALILKTFCQVFSAALDKIFDRYGARR